MSLTHNFFVQTALFFIPWFANAKASWGVARSTREHPPSPIPVHPSSLDAHSSIIVYYSLSFLPLKIAATLSLHFLNSAVDKIKE